MGKNITKLFLACYLIFSSVWVSGMEPPQGKLLFQPMLIWADSEVTFQGTGYVIEDKEGNVFGVTSIHFLEFEDPGLYEAIWLDIPTEMVVGGFINSYGRPLVKEIGSDADIKRDFILLPAGEDTFSGYTKLVLDDRKKLDPGERVWFPDKDYDLPIGHVWVGAMVTEDTGDYLEIKLDSPVELQSQSGSPILSEKTGKVVGMIFGGEEIDGDTVLWLCPARDILRFLEKERSPVPLRLSVH